MKRKQYLAGVLILSAFSLLASHTAHAKSATCTADIFYITGVMRGPDGVRHTIRADFPGARVSKRASGGLIARRVLSAACRAAVQEGFRRTLAGLTSNSIGQTLCRNYVITGERRPANEQLPRGSGVFVQATTLVVSTSQDRDISDYGGLPTADIDCGAALASADGTDRDYCNQFTNAIWPFIRTMHRMPCSGPLYGEFGLGATTNTVHNWCMRNRVRSFTTLRTIISNTFSCARNHLQTLGNIQAGQRANFCTGLSSWVHHMDQLWADMEVLRSYQRYPGTFGATHACPVQHRASSCWRGSWAGSGGGS